MANKRSLKKQIRYICGDIAGECIFAREFINGIDAEKMNAIVINLAELQERSIRNVSFSFDKTRNDFESAHLYKKAATAYYRNAYKVFYAEFNKHIEAIVKSMNALLPEAQREANKQAANN